MAEHFFTVRIRVRPTGSDAVFLERRPDSYFDVTWICADSEDEAIGYAISLAQECFGLPFRLLHPTVVSKQTVIDCC
jgi:hypothetical protein